MNRLSRIAQVAKVRRKGVSDRDQRGSAGARRGKAVRKDRPGNGKGDAETRVKKEINPRTPVAPGGAGLPKWYEDWKQEQEKTLDLTEESSAFHPWLSAFLQAAEESIVTMLLRIPPDRQREFLSALVRLSMNFFGCSGAALLPLGRVIKQRATRLRSIARDLADDGLAVSADIVRYVAGILGQLGNQPENTYYAYGLPVGKEHPLPGRGGFVPLPVRSYVLRLDELCRRTAGRSLATEAVPVGGKRPAKRRKQDRTEILADLRKDYPRIDWTDIPTPHLDRLAYLRECDLIEIPGRDVRQLAVRLNQDPPRFCPWRERHPKDVESVYSALARAALKEKDFVWTPSTAQERIDLWRSKGQGNRRGYGGKIGDLSYIGPEDKAYWSADEPGPWPQWGPECVNFVSDDGPVPEPPEEEPMPPPADEDYFEFMAQTCSECRVRRNGNGRPGGNGTAEED